MSNPTSDLITKVEKLLRLANCKGATPAEAMTAMSKAQQLMTANGISMSQLNLNDPGRTGIPKISHLHKVMKRRRRYDYDNNIAIILKRCFAVNVIWSKTWVGSEQHHTYLLIGEETDIKMAEMAIPILVDAMVSGIARHLKERGLPKWTATVGRSFYDGLTQGYIEGSDQGRARAYEQSKKHEVDAYAIVLVDKDKAITAYTQKEFHVKPPTKSKPQYQHDAQAYLAGRQTGATMDLSGSKLQ